MVLLTKLRVIRYYFVIRVFHRITGITLIIFKVNFLGKKPVSIKFPNDMLSDIDEECNGLGCNRTDFVIEAVQEKLQGRTEDQVIKDTKPEPKPEGPIPKVIINLNDEPKEFQNARIVLEPDPKQIDNSNKPQVNHVLFNGKYIPEGRVYNT